MVLPPSRPPFSTLMTAPTPNRRRMTLVSRPRTISCGLGRSNIGAQSDLHKLYPSPIPHIKVLRSFFKSDRLPPSPPFLKLYPAIAPRRRRIPSGAARERSPHVLDGAILGSNRTCTNYIQIPPSIKVLRSFFKSDRSPVSPVPQNSRGL